MKVSQATKEAKESLKQQHKTAAKEQNIKRTNAIKHWAECTVVPFIANVILVALALKGAMQFLPTLSREEQMIGGVIIVALLAYVAYKRN